jgi:hypothetical protein
VVQVVALEAEVAVLLHQAKEIMAVRLLEDMVAAAAVLAQ